MKGLRAWLRRVAGLLPNERRERELADEIESHLELHVEDNIRSGMAPAQALREALLKLGGVERRREDSVAHRLVSHKSVGRGRASDRL